MINSCWINYFNRTQPVFRVRNITTQYFWVYGGVKKSLTCAKSWSISSAYKSMSLSAIISDATLQRWRNVRLRWRHATRSIQHWTNSTGNFETHWRLQWCQLLTPNILHIWNFQSLLYLYLNFISSINYLTSLSSILMFVWNIQAPIYI